VDHHTRGHNGIEGPARTWAWPSFPPSTILLGRGHVKSTQTNIAYLLWVLDQSGTRMPSLVCVSTHRDQQTVCFLCVLVVLFYTIYLFFCGPLAFFFFLSPSVPLRFPPLAASLHKCLHKCLLTYVVCGWRVSLVAPSRKPREIDPADPVVPHTGRLTGVPGTK
jgi:hypothetical protein